MSNFNSSRDFFLNKNFFIILIWIHNWKLIKKGLDSTWYVKNFLQRGKLIFWTKIFWKNFNNIIFFLFKPIECSQVLIIVQTLFKFYLFIFSNSSSSKIWSDVIRFLKCAHRTNHQFFVICPGSTKTLINLSLFTKNLSKISIFKFSQ